MNIIRKKIFSAVALLLLLSSCTGEIVGEYCSYQCYYIMDFKWGHTAPHLASALQSTNIFAFFSCAPTNSGYVLNSQAYGTETHSEQITESVLTQPTRIIGLNNGLIVGRSSFQNNELYVFDRQCPNCYNADGSTNHMLTFSNNPHNVKCSNCGRTYGLLNGGVVVAGDNGEKLFRYRATFDGTIFRITNPQ